MLVTLEGIVMLVNELAKEKAHPLMLTTLDGME